MANHLRLITETATSAARRIRATTSILLLFVLSSSALADYLWPLPYGNDLTSIFGSARNRRYHAGIDVRTGGVDGKEVLAPADGYLMRVRTSYFGYGKALYLKMNDGKVAVFGHLSRFTPEVEEYVRGQQIKLESYSQDLYPPAGRFVFKRGQLIGYSGSTGIGAPHLHFEIRDQNNIPLNPLLFSGLAVPDNTAPRFERLRIVPQGNDELLEALGYNLTVRFKQNPHDGIYRLPRPLGCDGEPFWLAAEIIDRVAQNWWEKPAYEVIVRHEGQTIYSLRYDALPFERGHLIDAHRNFQMSERGDKHFFNLFSTDLAASVEGICALSSDSTATVEVIARDAAGHESRAEIELRSGEAFGIRPDTTKLARLLKKYAVKESTPSAAIIPHATGLRLLLRFAGSTPQGVRVLANDGEALSSSSAVHLGHGYFLAELDPVTDRTRPAAIDTLTLLWRAANGDEFTASLPFGFRRPWFLDDQLPGRLVSPDGRLQFVFPPLDEVFFPHDRHAYFRIDTMRTGENIDYLVTPTGFPLASGVKVEYKFGNQIPAGAAFYEPTERNLSYIGGEFDSVYKTISFNAFRLGRISVRVDSIPPVIENVRPYNGMVVKSKRPRISFAIRDTMSGIREAIEVRVNGQWVIPVYDYEAGSVTAQPHFDLDFGTHTLEIKVSDRAGNTRTYQGKFTITRG